MQNTSWSCKQSPLRRWLPILLYPTLQVLCFLASLHFFPVHPMSAMASLLLAAISLSYSIHISYHECVHRGWGRSPGTVWLGALLSFLAGVPFEGYRVHHGNHHAHNNGPEDYSSTWRRKGAGLVARHPVIYALGWPVSFWRTRSFLMQKRRQGRLPEKTHQLIRGQSLLLLAGLTGLGIWGTPPLLSYLLLIYLGWAFTSLHNYFQHPPVAGDPGKVVSFYDPFYNLIFSNNGLHWEHHDQPQLPWNELAGFKSP